VAFGVAGELYVSLRSAEMEKWQDGLLKSAGSYESDIQSAFLRWQEYSLLGFTALSLVSLLCLLLPGANTFAMVLCGIAGIFPFASQVLAKNGRHGLSLVVASPALLILFYCDQKFYGAMSLLIFLPLCFSPLLAVFFMGFLIRSLIKKANPSFQRTASGGR
jgi:hypothetical protein